MTDIGKNRVLGEEEQRLLKLVKEKFGSVPGTMRAMAERPGTLGRFLPYVQSLFEGGPLSAKEAQLVVVAAAAALEAPNVIERHTRMALKAGASKEEILQTILIAGLIGNTSQLHVSAEASGLFGE